MEAIVMKICATIFWLFLISVFGFAIYGNTNVGVMLIKGIGGR